MIRENQANVNGRLDGVSPVSSVSKRTSVSEDNWTISSGSAASQVNVADMEVAKEQALWGMFAGDAVAMPVHWFNDTEDIFSHFGHWITAYEDAPQVHPSPIFAVPEDCKDVISNILLHDKAPLWTRNNQMTEEHIHRSFKAGENTLAATLAYRCLLTVNTSDPKGELSDSVLQCNILKDYVEFMTTPNSHNDSFVDYNDLAFFRDWVKTLPRPNTPEAFSKFAESRKSEDRLLTISSITTVIPWIIRNAHQIEPACISSTMVLSRLTNPNTKLPEYIKTYALVLRSVLLGSDLSEMCDRAMKTPMFHRKREIYFDQLKVAKKYSNGTKKQLRAMQEGSARLGVSNFIDGALAIVFFIANVFADDFEGGILCNANCGGDSCFRGTALGALLGAATIYKGTRIPEQWMDGLANAENLKIAIGQFSKVASTAIM